MSFTSMRARVEAIYLADGHKFWGVRGPTPQANHPMRAVEEAECLAGQGIRGDRFAQRPEGHKSQITFYAQEVHDELRLAFNLPQLPAHVLRRNILVSGLALPALVGARFRVQGVHFEGVMECSPCKWMNHVIAEGAEEWLPQQGRGGLRARILTSGVLRRS